MASGSSESVIQLNDVTVYIQMCANVTVPQAPSSLILSIENESTHVVYMFG